jgi:ATP-dependent DNA helicase Rep
VIGPNPKLFPKNLWSELGEGEPVRVVDADNEEHEAERVVARIQSIRAGRANAAAWRGQAQQRIRKDFAVLYRANHQAKHVRAGAAQGQFPTKCRAAQSFFDRAEIKDLCAWFRLWVNNDDDPAFLRAITTPKRGIGHTRCSNWACLPANTSSACLRPCSRRHWARAAAKAVGSLHEFGRYVNDLEYRARHTTGAEAARSLPERLAQGNRLRKAPVRRRRQREGGRQPLDQRAGVLRLDGQRCGGRSTTPRA